MSHPLASPSRIAAWSLVPLLLLVPAVAMRFTDEVVWTAGDFVVFGAMLIGAGLAFEFVSRGRSAIYRIALAIGLLTGFLMLWVSLAVGIFGPEDEVEALMVLGVLAVGATGAVLARFEARGMAYAVIATIVAQLLFIGASAWLGQVARLGEVLILSGSFSVMFGISAALFLHAARQGSMAEREVS